MRRAVSSWLLMGGLLLACADPAPAKAPAQSASANALPPLPLPGDPPVVDAALIDPKAAGTTSDCIPAAASGDGDVDEAVLGATGSTLSICLAYHAPMAEAPAGRACFEVDLAQGRYDRVAPFGPAAAPPGELGAWLAQHDSNGFTLKETGHGDVAVCKGSACTTVTPQAWKPFAQRESCLPPPLTTYLPAAVSPDGATLLVVRHEDCDATHVFAETYDVHGKRRLARFPVQTDAIVDRVEWLGQRALVRACTSDEKVCSLSLVDPKAPATPTPHGFANAAEVPGVNPAGLEPYFAHGQGDLWAFVDRLGGAVVFAHADTGRVESTTTLPPADDMRLPLAVAVRASPPELVLVYGGRARVARVDLATFAQVASHHAPLCGEQY